MATKEEKLDKLKKKLQKWRKAYHNGVALVSDEEYDDHENLYRKYRPDDPFLDKVGATPNLKKVKLPFVMPSLKKVYPDKGAAAAYIAKSSGKIAAVDKLDGVSGGIVMKGKEKKLYTRGNGKVGQDVSKLLPHVKGIGRLSPKDQIRGELMLNKSTFQEKHSDTFENTRSMVSGVVNSGTVKKAAKDVEFIVHELVGMPWVKARVKLKAAGFKTAETKLFTNPTVKQLSDYMNKRKKEYPYDLDGLVLIDLVTGSRMAFKINQPSVKVTVDHVKWNISAHGLFKPTVIFKQAVRLSGVSVKKATGHNAAYIFSHKIGPGAVISVVRAGDVIPKVVGVVKGVKPQMPDNFQWDANKVEAISVQRSTKQEAGVQSKVLARALTVLGIEGSKLRTTEKLVEHGFDLIELFHADLDELKETGIGNVNATKLFQALKAKRRDITHAELMDASNIWPRGITQSRFELILPVVPFKKSAQLKRKIPQLVSEINGLSMQTGTVYLKHLPAYIKFLRKLGFVPKKDTNIAAVNKSGALFGKSFCFTGFRNKELEKQITDAGGQVTSFKKTLTALIVADKNSNSSKIAKAESLGIPIMEEPAFKKKFKLK